MKSLPALAEIATGEVKVSALKTASIEELLGRDPVEPIEELLQGTVAGKVVMVTGAGGSIGSELCRQILHIRPKTLLLVERAEYSLYAIDMELRESSASTACTFIRFLRMFGMKPACGKS